MILGWYRIWSDTFIEQGNQSTTSNSSNGNSMNLISINLIKKFSNTNYLIEALIYDTSNAWANRQETYIRTKTISSFLLVMNQDNSSEMWVALGY